MTGRTTNCIETTFIETVQAGAVTPTFSMNSVAMDCPGYIKTDASSGGATIAQVDAIVKAGSNNLYGAILEEVLMLIHYQGWSTVLLRMQLQ